MKFETEAVHNGLPRGQGVGVGLAIQQTTTFEFETLEGAADVFQGREEGYQYSRIQNPTLEALEARVSALENAAGAVVTASGQSATLLALISLARVGDHIVAVTSLFGGSLGILNNVLPNFGISSSIVENSASAIAAAIRPNTRAILVETIGNPALDVPDFSGVSEVAKKTGVALVVDNTWGACGFLCKPLELGADIVVHSLTKWAAGHGNVLGGAVLVRRGYVPTAPIFNEAQATGQSLNAQYGEAAFLKRARLLGLHQMGMTLSAMSAWQINLGLETLAVRVARESENTVKLAAWLATHTGVARVNHTSVLGHPHFETAKKYLTAQPAVLTFDVRGFAGIEGQAAAALFIENLKLVRHAANLGDTRTMVVHPWTTTHGRLPESARRAAGVSPETIRVSVGLEDIEDIKDDFANALSAIQAQVTQVEVVR